MFWVVLLPLLEIEFFKVLLGYPDFVFLALFVVESFDLGCALCNNLVIFPTLVSCKNKAEKKKI